MNIKDKAFVAIRWTTFSTLIKVIIGLFQVLFLAKMVGSSQFGLMSLILVVISIASMFIDFGVSNAIIHHQEITQEELSSLYWVNVFMGFAMMTIIFISSNWIASFYGNLELSPALRLISISFLISGFGQQLKVLAEKKLKFNTIAKIEIASVLIGCIISTCWAIFNPTVLALVAGFIASTLLNVCSFWIFLSDNWRPQFKVNLNKIQRFIHFGKYTIANNLVNMLHAQADILIGGKFLLSRELGIYSLPRDITLRVSNAINPIVTRVGLPVMATLQNDRASLNKVYLKTLLMTASVNFPIYISIGLFSQEFIFLLLGKGWEGSSHLLPYFCMWGMIRSTLNPVGGLLFAVGKAKLAFIWNFLLMLITFPVIWIAAHYGSLGLTIGLILIMSSIVIPTWLYLVRPICHSGFTEYFTALIRPLLAAIGAAIITHVMLFMVTDQFYKFFFGLFSYSAGYLLLSYKVNHQWLKAMIELIGLKK